MNFEKLFYELGVMAFNILNNETIREHFYGYDMEGNFMGMLNALKIVNVDHFRDGFISESQNYCVEEIHAEELFQTCLKMLREEEIVFLKNY